MTKTTLYPLLFTALICANLSTFAGDTGMITPSEIVLNTLHEMPQGGGYSTGQDAFEGLKSRIQIINGVLSVDHLKAGPSFCSGATYILFLKTLEKLHRTGAALITGATAAKLPIVDERNQALQDGFGVFGRWNANGPGTAGLFSDLDMGDNFADDSFIEAKPGDFLKIFWSWGRGVGKYERGHSVVFTGVVPKGAQGSAVEQVCFWSSHGYDDGRPSGMGEKCVARKDIQEMIFSRLTRPEHINRVLSAGYELENKYLSSLQDIESTIEEARRQTHTVVISPKP